MIALLAIAVIFSFAACDNSTQAGGDSTTTPSALDKVVASGVSTYISEIADKTSVETTDTVSATQIVFQLEKTAAVGSTPAQLVTLTISGVDTEPEATGAHTVRLTSWTLDAETYSLATDALSYTELTVKGLSGALQGTVEITKDATAGTYSAAGLSITRVFEPTACASAVVTSGDKDYDVTVADLLAQIANADFEGAALTDKYITEAKYEELMTAEYKTAIEADVTAFLGGLADGTADLDEILALGEDKGVTSIYNAGTRETAGNVVLTYVVPNGENDKDYPVVTNASGVSVALKKGSTFEIVFESAVGVNNGTVDTTFTPESYTIKSATLVVTDATSDAKVQGPDTIVLANVSSDISGQEITIVTDGAALGADAFGSVTALAAPTAGTATATDAKIFADVADATGNVPVDFADAE